MLKAVIFDMDGLMVDTEVISYQCYKEIIEGYGFDFTKEDYIQEYPGKSLVTSMNYIKNHYQIDLDILEKIDLFHKLEEKYMDEQGVELKKGLLELLQYLKENQYLTIIATSSIQDRAEKILSEHNIMKYFDNIVCGSEVKHGKPFPDIFLKACEKLKVQPHEALVLEDSETGIQAASDAHIPVICIPDMKYPHNQFIEKVETIYNSLDQVITYIEGKHNARG